MSEDNPFDFQANSKLPDWTQLTSADPIADIREGQWVVFLGRQLTTFERTMVRAGFDPRNFEL
jgi:hypothetical protein